MKENQKAIEKHLFVCTHKREVGECCHNKESLELFQTLKQHSKQDPDWKGRISVSQSSCLGFCSQGIAAVIYPDKRWITDLKKEDAEELIKEVNASNSQKP